jgi:hypothetical protein
MAGSDSRVRCAKAAVRGECASSSDDSSSSETGAESGRMMMAMSHRDALASVRGNGMGGKRDLRLMGAVKVPTPVVMPPRIPKGYGV